jgi:hypothetical protein
MTLSKATKTRCAYLKKRYFVIYIQVRMVLIPYRETI